MGLICWINLEALLKRLDAEIDSEADDKNALSHDERQKREAVVLGDLLAVERDEAALVWAAQAQGLPAEHRADVDPCALLGVRLVTARAPNGLGTSVGMGLDGVGGFAR